MCVSPGDACCAREGIKSRKLWAVVSLRMHSQALVQLTLPHSFPSSLCLAGQIHPGHSFLLLQSVLQPLEGPLRGVLSQLGSVLSRQPDLQFPIRSPRASTWLLNTYLDKARQPAWAKLRTMSYWRTAFDGCSCTP